MYFDSLTTAAIIDELTATVLGGRVQRVVQADPLSVGLEIYACGTRHQLLASADPLHPRVYLAEYKLRRGVETATPFLLLARKYVEGSRLAEVEHPPFERILRLCFSGPQGNVSLLAELMERRANLILLQGERILDAMHRVGPEINRYRTVLPNRAYVPPPPQTKMDPTDLTELRLRCLLADAEPDHSVWRVLVQGVAGISPLFAREIVFRATGSPHTRIAACARVSPLLEAFEEALIPYWEHEWGPSVAVGPAGDVTAFAPYCLTHLAPYESVPSISLALARYYRPVLGSDAYQAGKKPLQEIIHRARERLRRKRDALARQAPSEPNLERTRQMGELLLAFSSVIAPGQTELRAQYDQDGPALTIELDPGLSPVANARLYFQEYEKGKRAAGDLPARLATTGVELEYLDQLETDLALADTWPEIDLVGEALATAGFAPGPRRTRPRSGVAGPLRLVSEDGLVILVGRNSRQNEAVTFKRAAPNDLWLHAKGVPGGHVVVKNGGRPVPDRTLQQAARLAARYSAAREEREVLVDVVERKRVRRLKGSQARPGLVTYDRSDTIRVSAQST